MKMFKRLAAVLLAGAMVLAMLTACGNNSNATERKVIDAINRGSNTSYSNNGDLQNKVRSILSKVDDNGMIKVSDLPCYVDENGNKEFNMSDFKYDESTNEASFTVYFVTTDDITNSTTEVKALEVTEEALKKLDSEKGIDLNELVGSTGQDVTDMIKAIGVATYTAANGKTYIGLSLSVSMEPNA